MNQEVDAVITWVDGNDMTHHDKLINNLTKLGIERPDEAAPTRFNQCGEIEYCIKSILHFAPWIRTVYIVTDMQIPPIVHQLQGTAYEKKIKIIDHRDIFLEFNHYLPTFNSLAIESLLWRIENLSEQFIYFNDDVVLVNPVSYRDFFRGNSLVLRGKWKLTSDSKRYRYCKNILTMGKFKSGHLHRIVQENSAKLAHITHKFFNLPHVPFPLKKSTLEQFFLSSPTALSNNVSYSIRDKQQFSPVSLAHHLEIKQNTAIIDNSQQSVGIDAQRYSSSKIKTKLLQTHNKKQFSFVNIQNLDQASPEKQQIILQWFEILFNDN